MVTTTGRGEYTTMKKADYLVFGGLVASLLVFLYLTSSGTSSQNITVLENQRLIKQALLITQNNSERIIDNQLNIINLSKGLQNDRELLIGHADQTADELLTNQQLVSRLLNATLNNQTGFAGEHNQTQEMIQQVIDMLEEDASANKNKNNNNNNTG